MLTTTAEKQRFIRIANEELMDLFNQTAAKGKKWIGSDTQSEGTAA